MRYFRFQNEIQSYLLCKKVLKETSIRIGKFVFLNFLSKVFFRAIWQPFKLHGRIGLISNDQQETLSGTRNV